MKFKLSDFAKVGSSKRIYAKEYRKSGIPFYRGKEIIAKSEGRKVDNVLFISKDKYNDLSKRASVPQENDILISAVGTIGKIYHVDQKDIPFYFKDGNLIRIYDYNLSLIDPYYLYYLLKSNYAQDKIKKIEIGSTQKAITIKDISNMKFDIPSLKKQQEVARIPKLIDTRIKLNDKINDNLSKLRKIQYKKMIQQNRIEKVKLPQLFKISYGKNLAKSEVTSSGIPVFGANGLIGYTTKSSIINGPTVTITSRGSGSGYVNYLDVGEAFLTNNLLYLHDKENFGLSFSFETIQLCKPSQFVTGSAQPQLTIKNLSQAEVIIPTDINKIYNFKKQMRPIESTIKNNNFENIKLEKLKNMLLKKYF